MRSAILILLFCGVLLAPVTAQENDTATPIYTYTYGDADGNRYLADAAGTFPGNVQPHDITFDAPPLWVVGGTVNNSPVWTVALADGRVFAVQTTPGPDDVESLSVQIGTLAPGQPIAARYTDDLPALIAAGDDLSLLSHPVTVITDSGPTQLYAADNGDLVLWQDGDEQDRLALNLPPDAYPVVSDEDAIAVYGAASDTRYTHGIMGDEIEPTALYGISITPGNTLAIDFDVTLTGSDVFEGIAPFWADINDDGRPELITTISNADVGSQLVVYTADGEQLAQSAPIGQGFRWQHALAVAPFGINGETQLANIRTPHLNGMAEFYTPADDALTVNNAQLGYTSHRIGSRNLDQGLAADFNGNGRPELVVTDLAQREIVALENTLQGVQEQWRLPLDATLASNLAAVRLPSGELALAAGTDANTLRVWLPR